MIDPSSGVDGQFDVGISAGRIAVVSEQIDRSSARAVFDASGQIVTPGLVDLHPRIYWGVTYWGIEADPVAARTGVTTWRARYLETGLLPGPPHHGIGRSMKVGKEEIVGLLVALRRFQAADLNAERRRQQSDLEVIASELSGVPGVESLMPLADESTPYFPCSD